MCIRSVDPSLLSRIDAAVNDGTATRPWALIGRMLAVCQNCVEFAGRDCTAFPGDIFFTTLVAEAGVCQSWWDKHNKE